jgi:uncharacterized membrane protein
MNMRKSEMIILGLILLSFIIGIYFYPQMPEKMASHWNFQGEVDSYISKFWGLFLFPLILIGIALLFFAIPKIDPLKANIEKFRKYYDRFFILFGAFLLWIYLYTILWNLGIVFHISIALSPAFAILLYYLGILCENAKRNWFIGIRTPWTLSNEKVWEKTHKIGGKLFKITGLIALLGVFFPKYFLFFIFLPIILVATYTIFYSYFEYQKETK